MKRKSRTKAAILMLLGYIALLILSESKTRIGEFCGLLYTCISSWYVGGAIADWRDKEND